MKKFIIILIAFICLQKLSYAQSTSSDPFAPSPSPNVPFGTGDFLGWATGSLGTVSELTIKNDEAMPISFYTNAGGGLANMRMWIYESGGSFNDGFVGIGD